MCDALIEGAQHHVACTFEGHAAAEVLPQAERDARQVQAAAAAADVRHFLVAVGVGEVHCISLLQKTTTESREGLDYRGGGRDGRPRLCSVQ